MKHLYKILMNNDLLVFHYKQYLGTKFSLVTGYSLIKNRTITYRNIDIEYLGEFRYEKEIKEKFSQYFI